MMSKEKGDGEEATEENRSYCPPSLDEDAASSSLQQTSSTDTTNTTSSSQQGGRLWKLAGEQVRQEQHATVVTTTDSAAAAAAAAENKDDAASSSGSGSSSSSSNNNSQTTPAHRRRRGGPGARQWAETFMSNTRSRADPHATTTHKEKNEAVRMTVPKTQDEAFFVNSTAFAQKRVQVAQLLIAGIVGILVGWLGNAVVGTSCHFASVQVQVGQTADLFTLHFGLYKYSTVDSSLNGYKYCYPYSDKHEAPVIARIANLLALLAGTYTLAVVWSYLILGGNIKKTMWKWSIWLAWAAGLFQLATLAFFGSKLCRDNACVPGPAAYLALGTAVIWIVLGWELKYHIPEEKDANVANVEMSDLADAGLLAVASQEYMGRFQGPRTEGYQPPELS